jgi:5'-3' exonuclease
MDKLLIIDGHNLLFQMFFGMPSRIFNHENKPIHATIGFVGGLMKIIRQIRPTHIFVIFDGEAGGDRNEINPDYKANRIDYTDVAEEENPFAQLPDIYRALDHMNIRHSESVLVEADDVIAAYAMRFGGGTEIVISSNDNDFIQLVNANVSTFVYRGDSSVLYDEAAVRLKYGIDPSFHADYKCLIGDQSDNIKGVLKIGPKTAARLINQFGGVEEILAHADEITPLSIREAILQNIDKLHENMSLVKLGSGAPLPFEMPDLKWEYDAKELSSRDVLKAIGVRL